MQNTNNPDLKRAFEWFLSFIEPDVWSSRKKAIEKHLEKIHTPQTSLGKIKSHESISFHNDRIGWYLYLVEMILTEPEKYEPIQGARVVPVFERLGANLETLKGIGGIEGKVKNIVSFKTRNIPEPDSALFEILVALLWKKNGWESVSFIPEAPPEKRADIKAVSGDKEWFIECKRLNGSSEYSNKERKKWLKMWSYLRDSLVEKKMPVIFDIVFHVELNTLPDDFLVRELESKLPLLSLPCTIISDKQWEVSFDTVNLDKARKHLENFHFKMPSNQLAELIAGHRDYNRGFTHVVHGKIERLGKEKVNNKYLTTIDFAACAFWHCDAKESIDKKARNISKRLGEAVKQLPSNKNSVVHIGLETLDGVLVEEKRYKRIFDTVKNFDNGGKDLQWIYCHLFQSYAPPEQDWVIDEMVYYFSQEDTINKAPLNHHSTMTPSDNSHDGAYWLRDTP
jgi:hypothetical protein